MDYLALKVFPLALLILSAAALFATPRKYPAFAALMLFNIIRSWEYLASCCSNNPKASMISAFLMLMASAESMHRAGLRPWATVFSVGTGLYTASLAVIVGHAANPFKSGLHVTSCSALALGMAICALSGCREFIRPALMFAYVAGAAIASKQSVADLWWSTLAVQIVHTIVLIGFLVVAVVSELRRDASRPVP